MKSYPRVIKLENRLIGLNQPCFIIAEVGSNHNRDLATAKELIDVAAKAGVDAVKFQTVKFSELYLDNKTDSKTKKFIKELELEEEWYSALKRESKRRGIIFLSTPTYIKAVDLLFNIGVKAFKIASAQSASDLKLIAYAASKNSPLFISTGLVDFRRIKKILKTCNGEGNDQIILLHCVSLYPVPAEKASLSRIVELKNRFKTVVGYSDHSLGAHFTIAAVTLGAKVVEKHLTLNRKMKGPDHFFSLEPKELSEMVKNIREVESGLVIDNKFSVKEIKLKNSFQLKWVAGKDFSVGEKLAENYLVARRASEGINVDESISNFSCSKGIRKGELIKYESLRRRRGSV